MSDRGAFASQAATLRDNAKWLVASFSGAGAILFSGLSVANVTKVAEGGAWVLPVALAAIPLLAAGWALLTANSVLSAPTPYPTELFPKFSTPENGPIPSQSPSSTQLTTEIEQLLPTSVVVYGSMAGVDDRLVAARKAINNAQSSLDGSRERRQELEDAWRKLDDLQDGVREILDCARYIRTEVRYRKALPHFMAALVLVLLGVVSSGIVTGAAARERTQKLQAASTQRPKAVSFDQATRVRVYFSHKTTLIGAEGPNHCRLWDGIYARAVGGDFDRPLLLFAGYAPDDPLRTQLSKGEVMRCSTPWTWAGQSGDVILVPI